MRPESGVRYREDATGHLLCWGCGEFGQHGHGYKKEVQFLDGALELFYGPRENQAKHIACGASHTAVVTSKCSPTVHFSLQTLTLYLLLHMDKV